MYHASWNLGGVSLDQGFIGIHELEVRLKHKLDCLSIQEMPRGDTGWLFDEVDGWHVHSFRDLDSWRGAAVAFRASAWCLMRKRSSDKGIWCRLRRVTDGQEIWCGSYYFTQNASQATHARDVHEFLRAQPPTTLPVLIGGVANAEIKWGGDEGMTPLPYSLEAKGDYMIGAFMEAGLQMTAPAPDQWHVPTSRPRKTGDKGRQIDGVGGKHTRKREAFIMQDSYMYAGTDHDAVVQVVEVVRPGKRGFRRPHTAPRRVVKHLWLPKTLNQPALEQLAEETTAPYPSTSYRDPPEVRRLLQLARQRKCASDWKQALRARAEAKRQWLQKKVENAANGDWGAYKEVRKKGATGWEAAFATSQTEGVDPHEVVHAHLQGIYATDDSKKAYPFAAPCRSEDFTAEELREALRRGKPKKAVGADRVSHELLQALGEDDQGRVLLLEWYNRLLHGEEEIPADWGRAVMILIPKVELPQQAKDLRPICLGSAASKVYSRLLLGRTYASLRYRTPSQVLGEGRQTCDYIWSMGHIMDLEREWKQGLWVIKLDIAKAFDTLNRDQFLKALHSKMGSTEIMYNWWALFSNTDANLVTPWGSSIIQMGSGIRQGSVESPYMFAAAIDWLLEELASEGLGVRCRDSYEGLGVSEAAYVDDMLLWHGSREGLQAKVERLVGLLARWGLRVNLQKCQLYSSPHSMDSGPFVVDGQVIRCDDHVMVMGIPFRVGITSKEAMMPLFTKVKNKFWAIKGMFRAKTNLTGRLRMIHKVLGNTALWCAGALMPDQSALKAINTLQLQLAVWTMKLSKGRDEDWVSFRVRTLRAARYALQRTCPERWSTSWLRRAWGYAGHRARSSQWRCPPLSAVIDEFRTLAWWQTEQASPRGLRHPGRFFPKLMNIERALDRAAGGPWRHVAQNRDMWAQGLTIWLSEHDLPWASLEQEAIEG